jgi:hypothetical protein
VITVPRRGSRAFERALFAPPMCRDLLADPNVMAPAIGSNLVIGAFTSGKTLTGSVAETILGTILLPGKSLGQGLIRVTHFWTCNNNANAKNVRVRLNGIAGQDYVSGGAGANLANNAFFIGVTWIFNQVTPANQIGGSQINFVGATTSAFPITTTENTINDVPIVLTGQLANAGDILNLQGYLAEAFRF